MKFLPFLLLTCLTACAGIAPVQMNPYTTNTTVNADLHVLAISGSPTNGITATSATNITLAVAVPIINGASNVLQVQINDNTSGLQMKTTTNNVQGIISTSLISSNYATQAYATAAAMAATNGYPWGSLYDSANAAKNATNGYPWGSLYDASGAAQAATNGYPWGSLYAPSGSYTTNLTAAANSFTTNIVIPSSQTSWTITLPAAATNYIVTARLYLKLTANNHGLSLSNGALLDATTITGTTYYTQPFSITDTGDGRNFVVNSDGDYANFLDAGIPQHFQPAFVQSDFQIQAQFIYTVKK